MNGGHHGALKEYVEAQKNRLQRVDEIKFNVALLVILHFRVFLYTHISYAVISATFLNTC